MSSNTEKIKFTTMRAFGRTFAAYNIFNEELDHRQIDFAREVLSAAEMKINKTGSCTINHNDNKVLKAIFRSMCNLNATCDYNVTVTKKNGRYSFMPEFGVNSMTVMCVTQHPKLVQLKYSDKINFYSIHALNKTLYIFNPYGYELDCGKIERAHDILHIAEEAVRIFGGYTIRASNNEVLRAIIQEIADCNSINAHDLVVVKEHGRYVFVAQWGSDNKAAMCITKHPKLLQFKCEFRQYIIGIVMFMTELWAMVHWDGEDDPFYDEETDTIDDWEE